MWMSTHSTSGFVQIYLSVAVAGLLEYYANNRWSFRFSVSCHNNEIYTLPGLLVTVYKCVCVFTPKLWNTNHSPLLLWTHRPRYQTLNSLFTTCLHATLRGGHLGGFTHDTPAWPTSTTHIPTHSVKLEGLWHLYKNPALPIATPPLCLVPHALDMKGRRITAI